MMMMQLTEHSSGTDEWAEGKAVTVCSANTVASLQWEGFNASQTAPHCRQIYHVTEYHLSCVLKTSP